MTDSFEFKVGPPDDAENLTVMKIGIQARKTALKGFRSMQQIITETKPECTPAEGVGYTWQGMLSQAAYTVALTHLMLVKAGMKTQGMDPDVETLINQVQGVTQAFIDSMPKEIE